MRERLDTIADLEILVSPELRKVNKKLNELDHRLEDAREQVSDCIGRIYGCYAEIENMKRNAQKEFDADMGNMEKVDGVVVK